MGHFSSPAETDPWALMWSVEGSDLWASEPILQRQILTSRMSMFHIHTFAIRGHGFIFSARITLGPVLVRNNNITLPGWPWTANRCDLLILVLKHFLARHLKWISHSLLGILHKLRLREVTAFGWCWWVSWEDSEWFGGNQRRGVLTFNCIIPVFTKP